MDENANDNIDIENQEEEEHLLESTPDSEEAEVKHGENQENIRPGNIQPNKNSPDGELPEVPPALLILMEECQVSCPPLLRCCRVIMPS